jgi:hypothetical protein
MGAMVNWLKHYFIPDEGNDHQPHFLRLPAVAALAGVALVLELGFLAYSFFLFPRADFLASIVEAILVSETNESRSDADLPGLRVNPLLEEAARLKAEDMATKGYFAHTSPEGVRPWRWLSRVGYTHAYAGENLAVNFLDSRDVVSAWLNSPAHKANLLNPHYTEVGAGTAKGMYKGREVVFIVQFFGRPLARSLPRPAKTSGAPSGAGAPRDAVLGAPPEPAVLGAALPSEEQEFSEGPAGDTERAPGFTGSILGAPRGTANLIYGVLLFLTLGAILLAVFVKVEIQHPRLLINGIVFLLMIVSVLIANRYVALGSGQIF